ncbi:MULTISPECIES: DHA2 family efflux MFS transporter permease subunit [unclassified Rathayibacter]|uniref:DHA2 family efflux MFS transporter permease subunit n=1 Tax=unclassified Rathayibacter TaxID=2609250 RepID=UPI00188C2B3A|nr:MULTISPECIES: DHA2 family efflux MFS transporter permease subunit [unclassified Rathayibacter]MBF4463465.1 multidrug efflux MFS transporter [Rathayibacter sp. VKM Ac-2879]MBF4504813.1 multidrug efflux MFS transporter [Rathayibacter sp. VKM Ac-2878]
MTERTLPETRPARAAESAESLEPRSRLVISLLLVSAFVVILNETIMSVALPDLMRDFGVEAHVGQWLSTAFMLTMAVVIPITGYLIQRLHTRTLFAAAMTLFSVGTLTAALAPTFPVLLAARVVQAGGTAIMMPLLMTTVMTLVPPAIRGRMMGNISIVISVAPAVGPTISGVILDVLGWRWMFWIVLPIALAALALGLRRVENVTEPRSIPIDSLSVVLSVFGFGGLVYGLSSLGEGGAAVVAPWVPFVVAALGLGGFITRQLVLQRTDRALLDLRTFASANFTVVIVMMAVSMAALFGTLILLPLYTQTVLGLTPLQTGLLLLPGGLLMGLLAPFVGRAYDRFGPRVLLVPGSVVVAAALWGLTTLDGSSSSWFVLALHVVLSLGLAFMFTPLFTAGLGSVRPALYSHGSAVIGTVQQLGGAAGTALFVTVLSLRSASLAGEGADQITAAAGGIHAAFLCGAVIATAAIVAGFFVRRPAESDAPVPAGH